MNLGLPLRPAALGRAIAQLAALLGPAALRALVCRLGRPCYSPSADGPSGLLCPAARHLS
ncbi:hypothetical protein SGRA_3201 [Saprospira grandis str. Lewin]|uniref:Uncharacterized protein n=1 Tax=Saprospira grandis (strain Lewin) TaxID=984262 RepID=H6L0X3_SAPGL|nr:hypothetical protein SGRA_3201 [Saprospira grandis str. Lewin]